MAPVLQKGGARDLKETPWRLEKGAERLPKTWSLCGIHIYTKYFNIHLKEKMHASCCDFN